MIDMDPQGNATMGSGVDKHHLKNSVYEVLTGDASIEESIISDSPAGYDLWALMGTLQPQK